ncbi:MAG TPA: FtsQ-type POTRA domain-containing protein [Candidatus Limnocylindrales bacterium]|nr:FtsQ-type POTRA domain-containing protein [Candidatus Limnocylindrales bacterium]
MTARNPRRYRAAAPAGSRRRQPRIRRASAGLSPTRAGAILAMLVSAGAIYGLAATSAFGYGRVEIAGTVVTPRAAVEATLGLAKGTNLVGLATEPLEAQLRDIPSIADANISVGLPDTIRIDVTERRPIVIWAAAGHLFVVDDGGLLFAEVGKTPPPAIAALPVVTDDRKAAAGWKIGAKLDPVDLDAATRLGSLTPDRIGSSAAKLAVRVSDERGFTLTSGPKGWLAVFGFYGASQRSPALIPGQVQLLQNLLAGREALVATVILADDKDGTFIAKETPKPSASPRASASAKP